MTKKELLKNLEDWSDDTEIEISVAVSIYAEDLKGEDKVWLEITGVDKTDNCDPCEHCLIYTGKVTMG